MSNKDGIRTITKIMVGTGNDIDIKEIKPQIINGDLYIPFIVPHPHDGIDYFYCDFETTMLKIDKKLIKQIVAE